MISLKTWFSPVLAFAVGVLAGCGTPDGSASSVEVEGVDFEGAAEEVAPGPMEDGESREPAPDMKASSPRTSPSQGSPLGDEASPLGDDPNDFESSPPGGGGLRALGDDYDHELVSDLGGSATPITQESDDAPTSAETAIEEADIVELEGDRLYALSRYGGLSVIDVATPSALRLLGTYKVLASPVEMYIADGAAFVLYNGYGGYTFSEDTESWSFYQTSYVVALDVTDPTSIHERCRVPVAGYISDSRVVGDVLYVMSYEDGQCWGCENGPRTRLLSLDVSHPPAVTLLDEESFEEQERAYSWKHTLASAEGRFYVAGPAWGSGDQPVGSVIHVVDVSDPRGTLTRGASVQVNGQVDRGQLLDEYDGVLRVVSQPFTWETGAMPAVQTLSVESSDSLEQLASVDLVLPRPGRLRSVHFDGVRGYAITLELGDPIFGLDLSNPSAPVQAGELEVSGGAYYVHPHGDRVLGLGFDPDNEEGALTASLFDVSALEAPTLLSSVSFSSMSFGGEWASLAADPDRFHKSFGVLEGNLVLIPFAGWSDRSEGGSECAQDEYQSGIRLIDWNDSDDTLTLRGVAPARGPAHRAFAHRDALFTVSNDRVDTFDVADRDQPRAMHSVSLARRVGRVASTGDTLVTVGDDWWTNIPEITLSSLADPRSQPTELELPQLSEEQCKGLSHVRDVRISAQALYLTRHEHTFHPDGTSEERPAIVTVDFSDPKGPQVKGDVELEFTVAHYGYGYSGLVESGASVVNSGSTLVFSERQFDYDQTGGLIGESFSAHVVDLTDPARPHTTEVGLPRSLGTTGFLVDADIVATSHFEKSETNSDAVSFFLDRVDIGDPLNPVALSPVNVPGSLLAYDDEGQRAVVLDYTAVEKRTSAANCTERQLGWFESKADGSALEDSSVVCHSMMQTLHLVAIEDDRATIIDSYPLQKGEAVGSVTLGDDRLFVGVTEPYYREPRRGFGGTELLVIGGLQSGDFATSRLTLPTGDRYDGQFSHVVAQRQRVIVDAGWQGKLSVVDASRMDEPLVDDVAVSGEVRDLRVAHDAAFAAIGYDGVTALEFD